MPKTNGDLLLLTSRERYEYLAEHPDVLLMDETELRQQLRALAREVLDQLEDDRWDLGDA